MLWSCFIQKELLWIIKPKGQWPIALKLEYLKLQWAYQLNLSARPLSNCVVSQNSHWFVLLDNNSSQFSLIHAPDRISITYGVATTVSPYSRCDEIFRYQSQDEREGTPGMFIFYLKIKVKHHRNESLVFNFNITCKRDNSAGCINKQL